MNFPNTVKGTVPKNQSRVPYKIITPNSDLYDVNLHFSMFLLFFRFCCISKRTRFYLVHIWRNPKVWVITYCMTYCFIFIPSCRNLYILVHLFRCILVLLYRWRIIIFDVIINYVITYKPVVNFNLHRACRLVHAWYDSWHRTHKLSVVVVWKFAYPLLCLYINMNTSPIIQLHTSEYSGIPVIINYTLPADTYVTRVNIL